MAGPLIFTPGRGALTSTAAPSRPAAAPASLATDDSPPLHLPGAHFTVAFGALLLGSAGLVVAAPELALGQVFSPRLLGVVHLFTLGWITTSILGALCQFLPVAIGVPLYSRSAAYGTLALHGLGLTLFVGGLLAGAPSVFRIGALVVAVGLTVFAGNLALTLARAKTRDVTFYALALADAFLLGTIVLGGMLAWNLHSGALLGADRFTVLAVHIHVALAGWVVMVMVGVAHRLLPMFLLSHGASERPAQVAVATLGVGSGLLLLPIGHLGRVIAGALIALGIGAFLVQAVLFVRHRRRRAIDPGLKLALAGLVGLGAATLVAPFALHGGLASLRLLVAYVLLALVGAISTFIAGHYYKIVPFLVWYHRFGPLIGERQVPKVAELFSARVAGVTVVLAVLGTCAMLAGVALESPSVLRGGALAFAAAMVVEAAQMVMIARRRPT